MSEPVAEQLYATPPWPSPHDPMLGSIIATGLSQSEEGHDDEFVLIYAAGHGWMEGHVWAEQSRDPVPEPIYFASDDRPSPPFPSEHHSEYLRIIVEEINRFNADEEAILSEALLAITARCWALGYEEGLRCPGCMPPKGGERGLALRKLLRDGVIPVVADADEDPGDFELLSASVAAYKALLASRD